MKADAEKLNKLQLAKNIFVQTITDVNKKLLQLKIDQDKRQSTDDILDIKLKLQDYGKN